MPNIQAQLADGTILEFPEGTTDDVINNTVKGFVSEQQPQAAAPEITPQQAPTTTPFAAEAEGFIRGAASIPDLPGNIVQMLDAAITPALQAGLEKISPDFAKEVMKVREQEGGLLTSSPLTQAAEAVSVERGLEGAGVLTPLAGREKSTAESFAEGVGGSILGAPKELAKAGLKGAVKLGAFEGAKSVAFDNIYNTALQRGYNEAQAAGLGLATIVFGPQATKKAFSTAKEGGSALRNSVLNRSNDLAEKAGVDVKKSGLLERAKNLNPWRKIDSKFAAREILKTHAPAGIDVENVVSNYSELKELGFNPTLLDVLPQEQLAGLSAELQKIDPAYAYAVSTRNQDNLTMMLGHFQDATPSPKNIITDRKLDMLRSSTASRLSQAAERAEFKAEDVIRNSIAGGDQISRGQTIRDANKQLAAKLDGQVNEAWEDFKRVYGKQRVDMSPINDAINARLDDLSEFRKIMVKSPFVGQAAKAVFGGEGFIPTQTLSQRLAGVKPAEAAGPTIESLVDARIALKRALFEDKKNETFYRIALDSIDGFMDDMASGRIAGPTGLRDDLDELTDYTRKTFSLYRDGVIARMRQNYGFDNKISDASVLNKFLGNGATNVQNAADLNRTFGPASANFDDAVWETVTQQALEDLWYTSRGSKKLKAGDKLYDKHAEFVTEADYKKWKRNNERTLAQMPEVERRLSTYEKAIHAADRRVQSAYRDLDEFNTSRLNKYFDNRTIEEGVRSNMKNPQFFRELASELQGVVPNEDKVAVFEAIKAEYWKQLTNNLIETGGISNNSLRINPSAILQLENKDLASTAKVVLGPVHYKTLKELVGQLQKGTAGARLTAPAGVSALPGQQAAPTSIAQLTSLGRSMQEGRISGAYLATFLGSRLYNYMQQSGVTEELTKAMLDPEYAKQLLKFEQGIHPAAKAKTTEEFKKLWNTRPPYFVIPKIDQIMSDIGEEGDFAVDEIGLPDLEEE